MTKIYSLHCDFSTYDKNDADYDGQIVGDKWELRLSYADELNHLPPWYNLILPETVSFTTGNKERLYCSNFPIIDTTLTVLSVPLINTLESVGSIDWTLIPAHFIDKNGKLVNDDGFKVVYSNEHCDCFDYEQSEYKLRDYSARKPERVTERMKKDVAIVKKLVFRRPENGFPPYFRILGYPAAELYISEACHDAIADAGHTGLRMIERGDL